MKIAITASEKNGMEAKVDMHFGRTRYFAIVDTDSMEVDFIENQGASAQSGAGIQAAQIVADKGVEGVVSGNFGPKAFQALKAANIKLYSFNGGTINEVIEAVKMNNLEELSEPTNSAHTGLKRL